MEISRGRFAPSPTGPLHLGNLRTALRAYESATVDTSGSFLIRMEDLDLVTASNEQAEIQLRDLAEVGVTSDVAVVYQSERFGIYNDILSSLVERGMTFECFCTRREIREAVMAPHGPIDGYPGACRYLSSSERELRRRERPAALRLRVDEALRLQDEVQEIVLRRNDGVPAYNLAVVVDDELQGVTEVVRGADLVSVTPSQRHLQSLLGYRELAYEHVPLMLGADGERMSKRHGAVTLGDCLDLGFSGANVKEALLRSLQVGTNGWTPESSLSEWMAALL